MIRMFVRHDVSDYSTWRKEYDDFDKQRAQMGVEAHGVYQEVDNGNNVTAYHDFGSMDAARSFADSAELKAAMQNAGVTSAPQIWFTEEA